MKARRRHTILTLRVSEQGGCCCYCTRRFTPDGPRKATLEHVKAKMDGGTDAVANLKAACWHCNQNRGAQMNQARQRKRKSARAALAPPPSPG